MECNQRKLALSFLPLAAPSRVIKLIEHCDDSSDSTIVPFRMDLVLLLDSSFFSQYKLINRNVKEIYVYLNIFVNLSFCVLFVLQ